VRAEIRIAVAAGDVLVQNGDVFGTPVNTAARVETVTPPGEIYLTEAVYQNVNRNEIATQFVREFSLKGLGEPVRVYRTTFRHQTRTVHDAAVLTTDIAHFTEFAKSASPMTVEDVFDWWERSHREVAGVHGGVVRAVLADAFTMTFDEVNQAVEAWLDLYGRSRTFNAVPDCPFAVTFRAGVDRGDIRIFRSALYGRSLDGAAFCCRQSPIDRLAVPNQLIARLPPEILSRLSVETGTIPASEASRAQRAGVDAFVILEAR
jgi:class 3 adenylate cyclase